MREAYHAAKMPGVVDLGKPETGSRRRYRVLRIPNFVVEPYLMSKGGAPFKSKFLNEPSDGGGPRSGRTGQFSISPKLLCRRR